MNGTKVSMLAAALAVPVGLVGCGSSGGGGGGGSADTTYTGTTSEPELDESNSTAAATGVISGSTSAGTTMDSGGTLAAVEGAATESLSALQAGLDVLDKVQNQEPASGSSETIAGADVSDDFCESGSATYEENDTPETGVLDAGDSVTMSFNDCDIGNGVVYNGGMGLSIQAMPDSESMDATLEYSHLTVKGPGVDFGANGSFRLISGSEAATYGGSAGMPHGSSTTPFMVVVANIDVVNAAVGEEFRLQNAEVWVGDSDSDFTTLTRPVDLVYHGTNPPDEEFTSCVGSLGCVRVDHEPTDYFTFQSGDSYPSSGILRVKGANNSWVQLDASVGANDQVGISTSTGVDKTIPWNEVSATSLDTLLQ